jgi:hypothetical protein
LPTREIDEAAADGLQPPGGGRKSERWRRKEEGKGGAEGFIYPLPGLPRPAVSARFSRREASGLDCARGGGDVIEELRVKGSIECDVKARQCGRRAARWLSVRAYGHVTSSKHVHDLRLRLSNSCAF